MVVFARVGLCASALFLPACGGRAEVPDAPHVMSADGTPRLLTGLTADVTAQGVRLAWTVDESRAHLINGFACSYRTPAHEELGVAGAVGCDAALNTSDVRSALVAGLPEYGEYSFEVVAQTGGGGIGWPLRALVVQVAVTPELAGAAAPGRAVSGEGPVVTGCGPGDGPGTTPPDRPWRLDQIVSDAHLAHFPGRGWAAAGDRGTEPDWPEPVPFDELMDRAELDSGAVQQAASDGDTAAAAAALADERADPVIAYMSAATKVLLRPGPADGGWELRLHTGYPFGGDYAFEADHAVAGWADPGHPVAWPALYEREECPPPGRPDFTHDVALAVAHDAAGGRLEHSGYGWWVVAPVHFAPARIVVAQGGLSFGDPAARPPKGPARWAGRLSGHVLWNSQRWAVAGDVVFELDPAAGEPSLAGRVENLVLAPLDASSLRPDAAAAVTLGPLSLNAAADSQDGGWFGAVHNDTAGTPAAPAGWPAADQFAGDWQAAAYGPDAGEIAGRLRLWTPLAPDADPEADWPAQAVLVAGFGARSTP